MAEYVHVDQIRLRYPGASPDAKSAWRPRDVGRAEDVSRVGARRLFGFLTRQARDQALPGDGAPLDELGHARGFVGLVLHRRRVVLDGG